MPVNWMTQYSITARDDYKRCVCDKFGAGEADCPQSSDDPAPDPDPVPPTPTPPTPPEPCDPNEDGCNPDPEPVPNPWKTWSSLEDIRNNPHYKINENHSRTMY